MAGLLYFLPGVTVKPRLQELVDLGLTFDHPPVCAPCTGRGPNGRPGMTVADPHRVDRLGIYLEEQHWEPVPVLEGEPKVYVGWSKAFPPTPRDLARPIQLPGPMVKLADGSEWMVPRIQAWSDEQARYELALPRKRRRLADGTWYRGQVLEAYESILVQSEEFWGVLEKAASELNEDGVFSYSWGPLGDFAARLIAINYAVTLNDVSALGLFDGENRESEVATAAIEWQQRVEWIKKKLMASQSLESAGADSSPGAEACSQTTDQLLLT